MAPSPAATNTNGRQDLNRSELNELKRLGKRGFVASPKLDVIAGGGAGFESDRMADYESNRLSLRLANGCCGFRLCLASTSALSDSISSWSRSGSWFPRFASLLTASIPPLCHAKLTMTLR